MYDRGATPSECKVLYLQAASCTFLFGSRIRFNSCVKHKHSKTNCVVLTPQSESQIEECTLPLR